MPKKEEKRNLETIPVGSLGMIPLKGIKPLAEKVDYYLVKWRAERENESEGEDNGDEFFHGAFPSFLHNFFFPRDRYKKILSHANDFAGTG